MKRSALRKLAGALKVGENLFEVKVTYCFISPKPIREVLQWLDGKRPVEPARRHLPADIQVEHILPPHFGKRRRP